MDGIPNYEEDFYEVDSTTGNFVRLSHLNNKSSVLSPESQDITSQYLALQQLDAHQRMISRAKSIVDTSAPKSLKSYISVVNQQKKKSWRRSNNASRASDMENLDYDLRPATSSRMQTSISEEDDNMSLNTSLNKGVQTATPLGNFSSKTADKISWYLEALRHGELHSPFFIGTESSRSFLEPQAANRNRKKAIQGDILDWHTNCFVKPSKPFSPRIVANTSAKSKVKDMRCYNPPFRKKKHNSSHSSDTFESYDQEDESNEEENESQQSSNPSSVAEESLLNRATFSENVPNFKSSTSHHLHPRDHFEPIDHLKSIRRTFDNGYLYAENDNEEDKYLNFLSKVTEDILRSGVYSDKAIKQAFEFHMQFYQDEANKEKLQSLLSQMLEGLKISADESEEIPSWRNPLLINLSRPDSPPEKEIHDVLPDTRTDTEPNSRTFDDSNFHSMNQTITDDNQSDKNISQDNPSNHSENES